MTIKMDLDKNEKKKNIFNAIIAYIVFEAHCGETFSRSIHLSVSLSFCLSVPKFWPQNASD